MATRLYFETDTAAVVSPAYSSVWEQTAGASSRQALVTTKDSGVTTTIQNTESDPTNPWDVLFRQYVSGQYNAYSWGAGDSAKFQCCCFESSGQLNAYIYVVVRAFSADGNTDRGVIFEGVGATEFGTKIENRTWTDAAGASISMQAGDRLVVDVGFRAANDKSTAYAGSAKLHNDSDFADLPEDEQPAADGIPWIEFSPNLTVYSPPAIYVPKCIMVI